MVVAAAAEKREGKREEANLLEHCTLFFFLQVTWGRNFTWPQLPTHKQLVHWPFTTRESHYWKMQNPKFSEKPARHIDLLDSVLLLTS